MSEQNKRDAELRQIITDALVSMVSGVTGLVPPSGPGQIPDFIQAPIDRAVEKISASLPVGVPDALREAVEYLDDNPFNEIGAGSILHRAMRDALAAAPTVKAEQVPTPEFAWVRLLEALAGDNGCSFATSTDDYREAKPALIQLIEAGFFRDDADSLEGDVWTVAAGEQGEAAARFARCPEAYAVLSDVLNRVFDRPEEAPSLPAAVSADLTRVKCPCCPYEYDADSYDAGFIAGRGMCQVCDAAMPPKDLPAAGSAVEEVEPIGYAWINRYNQAVDHVAPFPPTDGGVSYGERLMTVAQHERIVAALSAQQAAPERVSVDSGELSDALGRVSAGLETELAAINQLRALLASHAEGGKV